MGEKNKIEGLHNSKENFEDSRALNHLSIDELRFQYQKLYRSYQNIKSERDILRKALNVYHKEFRVPENLISTNYER